MDRTGNTLTKTGSIALAIFLILLFRAAAPAAGIETTLENSTIAAGESTSLVIRITGASDIKALSIPKVPGLAISFQGKEFSLRVINFKRMNSTALRFLIEAGKEGKYRIPSFIFEADGEKLASTEVSLTVGKTAAFTRQGTEPARVKPKMTLSRNRAYTGEPVIVRYFLLSSGIDVRFNGFETLPETKGFIVRELDDSLKDETITENGAEYIQSHITSLVLIPAAAGNFSVGGRKGVITHEASEKFFDNFFPFARMPIGQQKRIFFDSNNLEILPLPQAGKPAGFNGDVGSFALSMEYSGDTVRMFEEKRVTVTVKGRGNLLTLSKPSVVGNTGAARIIPGEGITDVSIKNNGILGEKKFQFSVIPETSGKIDAGRFRLDFFNPETGKYEFSETGNLLLAVSGGKTDKKGMDFDKDEEKAEFNPVFIIAVIVILAAVIILALAWERKSFAVLRKKSTDKEPESISPGNNPAQFFDELEKAAASSDAEIFFRYADRILIAAAQYPEIGEDVKIRIGGLKERLYKNRFGGGMLSDDDMKEILAEIKKILSPP